MACELSLPLGWKIYPIFHISNLWRYARSERFAHVEKPPPPILVAGEEEYAVESILRHKGKGAQRLYQVLWKGHPMTEASWEPELNLQNASSLLEDYLQWVAESEPKRSQKRKGKQNK